MKDSYICSPLILLLCGCIAAPVINDTSHPTQSMNTQNIDRAPNASDHAANRPLKNVFEVADARQKQAKKRSLYLINEHLESVFNTAAATQIVFQRPAKQTEVLVSSISQNKMNNFTQEPLWPSETGTATYYAPAMEGRNTASGEAYDPEQLTAAHRTIPIGSNVRVTNLKTRQQIIVRINDRWGGSGDRIINLSKQATIQLGFGSAGTIPVQLDVESIPSNNGALSSVRAQAQALPVRLEESGIRNHSRLSICQNEADILGLTENFYRNHVTACLSRSE